MKTSGNDDARNSRLAKGSETAMPLRAGQTFEIRLFRRPEDLNAFLGEISIEAGKRESGTINRRLANPTLEPGACAFEFQLQFLRVPLEECRDGHGRRLYALRAGTNCLDNRVGAHSAAFLS